MGQFPELFKEYMNSEEGRELMKRMMKETLLEVLSTQQTEAKQAQQ
jgi:hypothetical protein